MKREVVMYTYNRVVKSVLMVITMAFFLSSCAWWDKNILDRFSESEQKAVVELMEDGKEYLERGRYKAAADTFQEVADRYPYSKFAIEAELKYADALYLKKDYDAAYDAYSDFERMHPRNKDIPYVIYQKGMCDFEKISTIDRAQASTIKAKEEFERLVNRYPRSAYTPMAQRRIRECYINLAEYELYVGHYYFRMKKYEAAMARYRHLIENYPDMGQYHEAMEYLSRCEEILAEEQERLKNPEGAKTSLWKKLNPFD
jgi:outer membrane protein assembly factor BamD